MGAAFKIKDRVEFTDARGNVIRGRVVGLNSLRVVFQRGWYWSDGERQSRSGYAWAFDPHGEMLAFPEVSIRMSGEQA